MQGRGQHTQCRKCGRRHDYFFVVAALNRTRIRATTNRSVLTPSFSLHSTPFCLPPRIKWCQPTQLSPDGMDLKNSVPSYTSLACAQQQITTCNDDTEVNPHQTNQCTAHTRSAAVGGGGGGGGQCRLGVQSGVGVSTVRTQVELQGHVECFLQRCLRLGVRQAQHARHPAEGGQLRRKN